MSGQIQFRCGYLESGSNSPAIKIPRASTKISLARSAFESTSWGKRENQACLLMLTVFSYPFRGTQLDGSWAFGDPAVQDNCPKSEWVKIDSQLGCPAISQCFKSRYLPANQTPSTLQEFPNSLQILRACQRIPLAYKYNCLLPLSR
jgi:hypothetical protein